MRRLILMVFLLFSIPAVSAYNANELSASDALDIMLKAYGSFYLVVGNEDMEATFEFVKLFVNGTEKRVMPTGYGKVHYEMENKSQFFEKHAILVGGPCANNAWKLFSNETCENWMLEKHQALVKIADNDGFVILLVGGTEKNDTLAMARELAHYKEPQYSNFFKTKEFEVHSYFSTN